jgi:hypothetical protein
MIELTPREPQHIVDMIDNEGWPDALGWLFNDDFGDEELNQLIYDAAQQEGILAGYLKSIKVKVKSLGADWYID